MEFIKDLVGGFVVLAVFAGILGGGVYFAWRRHKSRSVSGQLKRHFKPLALESLAITERQFPQQMRADLHLTLNEYLKSATIGQFSGLKTEAGIGGVDFAALLDDRTVGQSVNITAPQYEQLDIGTDEPIQSLKSGLWLLTREGTKFAILYAPLSNFGGCGVVQRMRIQIATAADPAGASLSEQFFRYLETAIAQAQCYRGKILSLEEDSSYFGQSSGVKVHRLSPLARDQVILPANTLDLLDRNIVDFVRSRSGLGALRMATKKGLLFYGPPGTGKTHTIRYLAGSLEGHTTFLITAEQVSSLGEYMTLARLLQPSLVVIEDVDLIARERTQMRNPNAELMLNKLLNEMDGLREDAQILFILTTNRPEDLEAALASRPGRIDQAIEFPLPDAAGREKLARLYSRGLSVSDAVIQDIVRRTENVSASFIKELMRRSAQFHLANNGSSELQTASVQSALDEMCISGGALNLKLLGGDLLSSAHAEER